MQRGPSIRIHLFLLFGLITCQTGAFSFTFFHTTRPQSISTSVPRQSTQLSAITDPSASSSEQTLYEVLGAKGTETKSELKQLYASLAKIHHPDAIQANGINHVTNITSVDFSQIAAAYKTLSDPKQRQRYDRSLQAARFSKDVTSWAEAWGRQAAPAMNQVLDQVAVPFLRRTTATTLAGLQAVSQDLKANKSRRRTTDAMVLTGNSTNATGTISNDTVTAGSSNTNSGSDLLQTFEKAMAAAKRAGKYVDSIELSEKSQDLQEKANQTQQQALQINQQRLAISHQRIQLAIHTPQSGLTSSDALICLSDLNETSTRLDELTMMDRLLLRNTVRDEIDGLIKAECEYLESQQADSVAQQTYQQSLASQVKLQIQLKQAKAAEAQARLVLEQATAQVATTKASLGKAADALSLNRSELEGTTAKLDRKSHFLAIQSERVRRHLVRKEKTVQDIRGTDAHHSEIAVGDTDSDIHLEEIDRLKQEERKLAAEYEQLTSTADRYLSRANILTERAQEWKKP